MIASALTLDTAMHTDPGSYASNEDRAGFRVWGESGIWVVADGLGAKPRSEVGARVAVEAALDSFIHNRLAAVSSEGLETIGRSAHERVVAKQSASELSEIRTTLAIVSTNGTVVRWLHIGDTRVYHWRDGVLRSRTADHSLPQLLVDSGTLTPAEIRGHPDRGLLLAAVGQKQAPFLDVSAAVSSRPGDAFLICTDGWWEALADEQMTADLAASATSAEWVKKMAGRITRRRLKTQDHYTAIGIRLTDRG